MISFEPSKALGLVLAFGIILHANSALATDVQGDAQMQARDLLSGTTAGRSKTNRVVAAVSGDAHAFNLDPQEQARQLILGKPNADRVAGRRVISSDSKITSVGGGRRAAPDPHEAARRMVHAKGV